ncbi:ghrelin O-acyltransferase [Toxotes jaculatrix]|uniref:ghrelin O-acyltransferase n=1 Tax=Toxotes jaculatrix TaxID=941984 RepID=UPI001B3A8E9E|nr:ghrelin O-acyltransferase [Toxotes jaculatrix]
MRSLQETLPTPSNCRVYTTAQLHKSGPIRAEMLRDAVTSPGQTAAKLSHVPSVHRPRGQNTEVSLRTYFKSSVSKSALNTGPSQTLIGVKVCSVIMREEVLLQSLQTEALAQGPSEPPLGTWAHAWLDHSEIHPWIKTYIEIIISSSSNMGLITWLVEQHQFLMHQCFSLPFAFLFYFFAKHGYLSLTCRYLFVAVGGCVLAVVTMGIYSVLLFASTFVFILLVTASDPGYIHPWVLGIQMLWQTFWHLVIQYREYCMHEPVTIRLFLAVSSLMLLTQRITSVSMDLQENRVMFTFAPSSKKKACATLLPFISYVLSFTTLLGGPLCSYSQFVSLMEGISLNSPPSPLGVVFLKLIQVLLLELVRFCLVYFIKQNIYDPSCSTVLCGVLWVWGLALVLRIQYYSHWRISECLNNAAGFRFHETSPGDLGDWSGLSDGDFWTTEASSRVSQFARRWNATTVLWLRRLIYIRCKRFPLLMTFGFSLWWHGLHLGHFVGFFTWAATVKADYYIHRCLQPKLSSTWRKLLYTCLGWINTQMIITCVVIAVEFRNMSGLRLLCSTYIGLFPLCNTVLHIFLKLNKLRYNTKVVM